MVYNGLYKVARAPGKLREVALFHKQNTYTIIYLIGLYTSL